MSILRALALFWVLRQAFRLAKAPAHRRRCWWCCGR